MPHAVAGWSVSDRRVASLTGFCNQFWGESPATTVVAGAGREPCAQLVTPAEEPLVSGPGPRICPTLCPRITGSRTEKRRPADGVSTSGGWTHRHEPNLSPAGDVGSPANHQHEPSFGEVDDQNRWVDGASPAACRRESRTAFKTPGRLSSGRSFVGVIASVPLKASHVLEPLPLGVGGDRGVVQIEQLSYLVDLVLLFVDPFEQPADPGVV